MLIVVDEPDTLLTLRQVLETAGYDTVLAADGDTALKRLATLSVDAVVLDVMMPVGDGWTLFQQLRQSPVAPPVVVVSGQASPRNLERARQRGANGTVPAPIGAEEVTQAVAQVLAQRL